MAGGRTWHCDDLAYVVTNEHQVVELFAAPSCLGHLETLFAAALEASGATSVLCKSFDTQLLFAALSRPAEVTSPGLLFRRIADPAFRPLPNFEMQNCAAGDMAEILHLDDGFFDGIEELESYADAAGLSVLRVAGEIAGCGIAKAVIPSRNAIDIGMWVAPAFRRQGFGSYLAAYMKNQCLQRGLRPICGCGSENAGSYRALNAAGFVSEHRLLRIEPRTSEATVDDQASHPSHSSTPA